MDRKIVFVKKEKLDFIAGSRLENLGDLLEQGTKKESDGKCDSVLIDLVQSGSWIGFHKTSGWVVAGTSSTFSHWGANEGTSGNEKCVQIRHKLDAKGPTWADMPCSVDRASVCEKLMN